MSGTATPAEGEWYARAAGFHRCEWRDPEGNRCVRLIEHFLDGDDPNHRVRLTTVREYAVDSGLLVETRYEP